jgi:hypothetical protein
VVRQALEDVGAIADVEADLEVGEALAEPLDERRQQELAGGRDRADAQRAVAALGRLARGAGALLEQPEDVGGVRRIGGAGRRRPQRPPGARSVSATPSSRSSAATAAETDGCVTTSSSAAAVTDPRRTTARKATSWVRVTAMGWP